MESDKPCNRCGAVQPLDLYYRDRSLPDGRRKTCIACDKIRKASPEVREQSKRYYHSDKGKAAERRYVDSGRKAEVSKVYVKRPEVAERIRQTQPKRSRTYYLKHRERLLAEQKTPEHRAKQRGWKRKQREDPDYVARVNAYHRAYSAQGKAKDRVARYLARPEIRARHLQWHRRQERARIARNLHLPATLTLAEWQHALNAFGHACAYCGGTGGTLEQDHVIPISKGGAYTADNIVPACKSCNTSKKNRPLVRFATTEAYIRITDYLKSSNTID